MAKFLSKCPPLCKKMLKSYAVTKKLSPHTKKYPPIQQNGIFGTPLYEKIVFSCPPFLEQNSIFETCPHTKITYSSRSIQKWHLRDPLYKRWHFWDLPIKNGIFEIFRLKNGIFRDLHIYIFFHFDPLIQKCPKFDPL